MTLASFAVQLKCAARPIAGARAIPALWLLSDARRLRDPRAALGRLPAGSGFIFRHYELAQREKLGRELLRICRRRRIIFLLAGDWRMAVRMGADGVHFPEALAGQARAMRRAKPNAIITVAAHGARAVQAAHRFGADATLLSPVFATQSHPGGAVLGPIRFARATHSARMPIIALGGLNRGNAQRLKGSGAAGIAGISGLV